MVDGRELKRILRSGAAAYVLAESIDELAAKISDRPQTSAREPDPAAVDELTSSSTVDDLNAAFLRGSVEDATRHRYRPGGDVELMTEDASLKGRLRRTAGRAALSVQRETFPYAYVTVDGPVTLGEPADDDLLDIATRYLGSDGGRAYVEGTPAADNILVRITPERWFSTGYSALDLG